MESFPIWREGGPLWVWLMVLKDSCWSASARADGLCSGPGQNPQQAAQCHPIIPPQISQTQPRASLKTSSKKSNVDNKGSDDRDNYTPANSFKGYQSLDWMVKDFSSTWHWYKQSQKQTKSLNDKLTMCDRTAVNVWKKKTRRLKCTVDVNRASRSLNITQPTSITKWRTAWWQLTQRRARFLSSGRRWQIK